jgi:ABC-type multidrug transport system ATPase subunit
MQITLTNTGKRYNREWIFRHISTRFESGKAYAITGANGSGKSTLLQVIAGAVLHNEGSVAYESDAQPVDPAAAYRYISFAAPYLELIEEMTATELLRFHASFKTLTASIPAMLEAVALPQAAHKQIRYFSSGMKQRLKLAQAFFTDAPVLLLDEPTTNLDAAGIRLYHELVQHQGKDKLIVVGSNDPQEYSFCTEKLDITPFKITD